MKALSQEIKFKSDSHLTKFFHAHSHGMLCTYILHYLPVVVKLAYGEQVNGSGILNITLLLRL
jgi:hypothetical protein